MKTSITSYSFQQYIKEGKMTQLDTVKAAHELGFEAMEFVDIDGKGDYALQCENARKIKAEADKYGIKIIAYAIGAQLYMEDEAALRLEIERVKGQIDIAKILGCKTVRHDSTFSYGKRPEGRTFDGMLPTIAKATREITEYAATKGIRTCTENHGFIAQDSDRVERLINAVNHENFGALIDMGNFLCADENPVTAVSRLAGLAFHAHCKDIIVRSKPVELGRNMLSRGGNTLILVAVGEGDVPVEQCLRILKKANYDGYITIEYEGERDCIEGIRTSKKNLDRYIAAVEG